MDLKRPKTFHLLPKLFPHSVVITIIMAVFWVLDARAEITFPYEGDKKISLTRIPLLSDKFVCWYFTIMIKPPAKRQKSIALAKSESMVPNMQNLISRPMGTLFLVSDAPQTSISRKTDLSSIIEVFPEFQLDQKGGKIQNPLCRPPHFFCYAWS